MELKVRVLLQKVENRLVVEASVAVVLKAEVAALQT